MSLVLNGSGTITGLSAGGLPSASVTQTSLAAGVAGNGPAFSAYPSSTQSLNGGVFTKIAFQTEEFDTNNNFDSATNYRFLPTVAGYYQVNASITGPAGQVAISIYKNGSVFKAGSSIVATTYTATVSTLIYLNGSTDYIEAYGLFGLTGATNATLSSTTYFQGFLARAA